MQLDLPEESIADFNQVIQINPEFVYLNRGLSKALSEDMDGACNDWNKEIELGEELPEQLAHVDCRWTRDESYSLDWGIDDVILNPSVECGGLSHK